MKEAEKKTSSPPPVVAREHPGSVPGFPALIDGCGPCGDITGAGMNVLLEHTAGVHDVRPLWANM